jgi:hypothetical protein
VPEKLRYCKRATYEKLEKLLLKSNITVEEGAPKLQFSDEI